MTDPVSGRLSDAPPTATEIEPGSTIRAPDRPVNEVRSACSRNATRQACPGASVTRANPASQRTGRTSEATGSLRYSCTTSVPARAPVLRTVQEISTVPSVGTSSADSTRLEYPNFVYESPWPNANSGVGSTELAACSDAFRDRRYVDGCAAGDRGTSTGSLPLGATRPVSTPAMACPPSSPGKNACTASVRMIRRPP